MQHLLREVAHGGAFGPLEQTGLDGLEPEKPPRRRGVVEEVGEGGRGTGRSHGERRGGEVTQSTTHAPVPGWHDQPQQPGVGEQRDVARREGGGAVGVDRGGSERGQNRVDDRGPFPLGVGHVVEQQLGGQSFPVAHVPHRPLGRRRP